MSDRRFLVVVLGALTALVGAAMVALPPLVLLTDPTVPSGETGTPVDVTAGLVGTMVLGVLVVATGLAITVGLVRAQLRTGLRGRDAPGS